jgi:hypothetical protein
MKLAKLTFADIYRDGGSYRASFETDDGRAYTIWLQRSRMPDAEGLHHRWLFAYFGSARPEDAPPVVTGSEEERALLAHLCAFIAAAAGTAAEPPAAELTRVRELVAYIRRREPCLPADLAGWRRGA